MADVWEHISFNFGTNVDNWYIHVRDEGYYSNAAIKHALYGISCILPFAAMCANTTEDTPVREQWLAQNWAKIEPLQKSLSQLCTELQRTATAQGDPGRKARHLAENPLTVEDLRKVAAVAKVSYEAARLQQACKERPSLGSTLDAYYSYIFALLYTEMVPIRYEL